jgi:hypothetical protein
LPLITEIINLHNPNAFYTIEEIKRVSEGYILNEKSSNVFKRLLDSRKNK